MSLSLSFYGEFWANFNKICYLGRYTYLEKEIDRCVWGHCVQTHTCKRRLLKIREI